jgi:hypothetical protein
MRFEAIAVMADEGLPVQPASSVLGVSESGFYRWRKRPPSARSVRHAWLIEEITAIHAQSRGVYGARRVHTELRLGRGIIVSHGQVELLLGRAGLKGLPGNRRRRPRDADRIRPGQPGLQAHHARPVVGHRHRESRQAQDGRRSRGRGQSC